jgi:hypothetical protein
MPKIAKNPHSLPVRFEIVGLISTVREHLAGYSLDLDGTGSFGSSILWLPFLSQEIQSVWHVSKEPLLFQTSCDLE